MSDKKQTVSLTIEVDFYGKKKSLKKIKQAINNHLLVYMSEEWEDDPDHDPEDYMEEGFTLKSCSIVS